MGEEILEKSNLKDKISKIKIIKIAKDIKKMETVGELIDYISMKVVERIAFFLLLIWSISLIITMIYSNISVIEVVEEWITQFNQFLTITIKWSGILQQTGFAGCLLGIVAFLKSLRESKKNNISNRDYIKERIIPLLLFLLLVWSIIPTMFATDKIEALRGGDYRKDGLITYFAVAGIFSCAYIMKNKKHIKCLIEINTLVALIQSVFILINNKGLNRFFGLTEGAGIFSNINHAGYYLAMTAMCAVFLIISEENSKAKLIFRYGVFSIIIAALVINSSFGPYLATLCAIISVLILSIWLKKISLKRTIFIMILFILVSIIINIGTGNLYLDLRIFGIELGMIFRREEDLSEVGTGRGKLWAIGIKIIADNPILGVGPGNISDRYFQLTEKATKPHNEFIEYAVTLGIPGLLFYVLALFMYLKEFFIKRKDASLLVLGLLCVTIAYLVSSLIGVIMYHTMAFFFMFLGLSVGQLKQTEKSLKETKKVQNTFL